MSKTTMHNPMKVITGPNTRWSYANVWEPKYSVSLIIPKSDTVTVAKVTAAIEAAYKEGEAKLRGNSKSVSALSAIKTPLRDGDADLNPILSRSDGFLRRMQENIAKAIIDADTMSPDGIQAQLDELQDFIGSQQSEITEFDESLVRKMIQQITVYDDHLTVRFKSGLEIDINE